MHLDQMTTACSCIKPPGGLHSCHLATFSFADVYLFKNQHARYLDLMTTNGVNIRMTTIRERLYLEARVLTTL